MPEKVYTEADITLVDGVTAIRARPSIYVGDTASAETLCTVVRSALGLALDALTESPAKHVELRVSADGVFDVRNDGSGLPISLIDPLMTELLWPWKYAKRTPLNERWFGPSVVVLNALSKWCEVTVRRDGGYWHQRYEFGKPVHELRRVGDCTDSGITLRFKLDSALLTGPLEMTRIEELVAQFNADVASTRAVLIDTDT
ncbi:MAG: hypothetical protein ACO1OB_26665 [Archangium sp.]